MGIGPVISSNYGVKQQKQLDQKSAAPNFNGTLSFAEKAKIQKSFAEWLSGGTKGMINFINGRSSEAVNILVTAFGTAIISPIFIVFNPIAQEDKETRIYSAWRQPISAIITAATTLGGVAGYNKLVDMLASGGHMAKFKGIQYAPKDSYIKEQIKSDGLKLKGDELSAEVKRRKLQVFEDSVKHLQEEFKNKGLNYNDLVDPDDYKKALKFVESDERFMESLAKMSKKERLAALDKKVLEAAHPDLNKMVWGRAKSKQYMLRQHAAANPDYYKELMAEFDALRNSVDARKLDEVTKAKFPKLFEDISDDLAKLKSNNMDANEFKKAAIKLQSFAKLADRRLQDSGNLKMIQGLEKVSFDTLLKNEEIRKYVRAQIKNAETSFKTFKNVYGMITALIILPFACGFLNWAHPRIMEIIMPESTKKRTEKLNKLYGPEPLPATEVKR